jgi:hypothetical protein
MMTELMSWRAFGDDRSLKIGLPSNLPREVAGSLRERNLIRFSLSYGDVETAFLDSRAPLHPD